MKIIRPISYYQFNLECFSPLNIFALRFQIKNKMIGGKISYVFDFKELLSSIGQSFFLLKTIILIAENLINKKPPET